MEVNRKSDTRFGAPVWEGRSILVVSAPNPEWDCWSEIDVMERLLGTGLFQCKTRRP